MNATDYHKGGETQIYIFRNLEISKNKSLPKFSAVFFYEIRKYICTIQIPFKEKCFYSIIEERVSNSHLLYFAWTDQRVQPFYNYHIV